MPNNKHLPILYSFRRCPYAIRTRMTLSYLKVDVAIREIALKDKPQEMLDASPKGTVPVLVLDEIGNHVIDESLDIMRWAIIHSKANRQVSNWNEEALQNPLIQTNDNEFKSALDKYKYHVRFPEYSQSDYFQQALKFIEKLEQALLNTNLSGCFRDGENNEQNNKNGFGVVDVAIFPFIRQFAYVDIERFNQLPYVKVQQWLRYMLQSELFTGVMQKWPLYQAR